MHVPVPLSVKKLSHAPMISMLHTMMILAVCLSTVLLLPPCLGMQTEQTELVRTPISWNTKEWGEGDGPYLLWNSKMQEPRKWNASEDDGTCDVMWCDANDENKMLTLYTTTPHVQTLHHQDPPVTMSGDARKALEYSLSDDKFMSSTEAEKLDEMRSRERTAVEKQLNTKRTA